MTSSTLGSNPRQTEPGRRRSGRAQQAPSNDPYRWPEKPKEPAVCRQCGAVYHQGRWTWQSPPPADAVALLCQACHRLNDDYPAGLIKLSGLFVAEHMDDLILLAQSQAEAEGKEHPLNRIMYIKPTSTKQLEISTTDIHLPRRIGATLVRSYRGSLKEHYSEGEYFVRVTWRRD